MTRLVAQDLVVRRGGRAIVDGVSLTLERGLVAVIGPNGAGKSTLLSCLAGLLRPDRGMVSLDERPLAAIRGSELARQRAYLPQGARAEWPVSTERLVALGLTPQLPVFGGLPAAMAERVARMLDDMDLAAQRDQPATTLSGGELARAMLARALVGEPEMLIADEPLAGLDPRHALDGIVRLRTLAEAGTLVIASIHDLTLVARHATHVAVLREGRLIAYGPTSDTLSADLLRATFDVEARVVDAGQAGAFVDFS
jgi:iron complex transport system ATP-binding protein